MRKSEKIKLQEIRNTLLKLGQNINLCFSNEESIPTLDDINSIKRILDRSIINITSILGDGHNGRDV